MLVNCRSTLSSVIIRQTETFLNQQENAVDFPNSMHITVLSILLLGMLSGPIQAQDDQAPKQLLASAASIKWVNEPSPKDLPFPEGVQHLSFRSNLVEKEIGYCIYLPKAYRTNAIQRFPVIYNLHGNGGNEFTGLPAAALLHQQIESGHLPPLMMVMFNGGKSTFYKNSADGQFPIESIFITEFVPYIDATYRTIAEGAGRCIEGFSMGGRGSTRLAIKYPSLFCSLFCQAGNVPRLIEFFDSTPAEQRHLLLLGEDRKNWVADDVYANCEKNLDQIKQHLRIQIACGTQDDGHLPTVRDLHSHLTNLGIDHTYIELEGLAHQRPLMMKQLGPIWFDYHVESLRRSGALD